MVEPTALLGQVVDGRWELVDHLGSGQFGEVYAAEPRHLELAAGAVKIVHPRSDSERHQILSEIQTLAELSHDGLLGYRDAGEIAEGVMAGGIYIVTELCEATLADEDGWGVGSEDFQARLAVAVGQVAAALGYLHERGFIHRDVKPANILRSGETWKLSDFGLVRSLSDSPRGGAVEGTAPYLAPEVTTDDGAGSPADIYALGVVVHQALTGVLPYDRPYANWSRPPLEEGAEIMISPVLPDQWRSFVEASLTTEARRRPTTREIPALVPDRPEGTAPTSPARRMSRTERIDTLPPEQTAGRRSGPWVGLGMALILATLFVVAVLLARSGPGDGSIPAPDGPDTMGRTVGGDDAADPAAGTDTGAVDETESAGEADSAQAPRSNFVDENGVLNVFRSTTLDAGLSGPVAIRADHVAFSCRGNTISGRGSQDTSVMDGQGISIRARSDVMIEDCVVTDFYTGIFVGNESDGVEILNNDLVGNGEGIRVDRSLGATLVANRAESNDSWGVILTEGSTNVLMEGNTAERNGLIGFALNRASDNELRANRATANPTNFSIGSSDRNLFVENLAEGAGEGFFIANSNSNGFENNTAVGVDGPSGFALDNADGNRLVGNSAAGYGQGFTSYLGSAGNVFEGNTATDNGEGMSDASALGSGTAGTHSDYIDNTCSGNRHAASTPAGLC